MGARRKRTRRIRERRSEIHTAWRYIAGIVGARANAAARDEEPVAADQARRRLRQSTRSRRFPQHEKGSFYVAARSQGCLAVRTAFEKIGETDWCRIIE